MRLENSELRAFRAVIEEGGFKRAADALHISQSAVSQAVAGLESKLGMPLVQRGKELQLTDVGKRLFEHAVDVLRGEQQTLEDIAQLKQGNTETLNLALSGSINRFYAPQLISAYYQDNPNQDESGGDAGPQHYFGGAFGQRGAGAGSLPERHGCIHTVPLYRIPATWW